MSPRRGTFEAKFEKWQQIKSEEDYKKERIKALEPDEFENYIRSQNHSFSKKTKLYKSKSSGFVSTAATSEKEKEILPDNYERALL